MTATARIFDIQRFSIHDGPGIRTTVFFKGCPLRCRWCHNPESQSSGPSLAFSAELCLGCGACLEACPSGARRLGESSAAAASSAEAAPSAVIAEPSQRGIIFNRSLCRQCGRCTEVCPGGALELVGRDASLTEIIATVLRDRPFYETSGGGMTLSGGEPLVQIEAAAGLLQLARAEHLHTALDTCGYAPWAHLERVLPLVDLFLYDIKETDPQRHRQLTGVDNGLILDNLRRLHDAGGRIRIRLPIIPGCNDCDEHFAGIGKLASELPQLEGFDLLAYHPLGKSKWRRFGLEPQGDALAGSGPEESTVATWRQKLRALGVPV